VNRYAIDFNNIKMEDMQMVKYDKEWLYKWILTNRAKEDKFRQRVLDSEERVKAREARRRELEAHSAVGARKVNADGSPGVWTVAENAARARARARDREILARYNGIEGVKEGGAGKHVGRWGVSAELERKLDAGLAQWGDEATQAAWRDRWANPDGWWATRASGRSDE
jgi:hypothetical protein